MPTCLTAVLHLFCPCWCERRYIDEAFAETETTCSGDGRSPLGGYCAEWRRWGRERRLGQLSWGGGRQGGQGTGGDGFTR